VSRQRTEVTDTTTDEALMLRLQAGDRAVFSVIVRRHQTRLYNFVLRHVRSPATSQDIVQDAFLRVVQNATDFKHSARFTTWLFTIAHHLCIDHLRRQALRRHPSLDEPSRSDGGEVDGPTLGERTLDSRADVERVVVGTEIQERVARAVEALPDEQREVFLLREVSNLPFKEIAQIVGAPENTVKSRMRYALERLQEALCEFEEYARALR
jgi:RNA polymerase sigma-70 factor (ECF subfamily)